MSRICQLLVKIARCLLWTKSERDLPNLDCAFHFDMRCMNGKGSGVTFKCFIWRNVMKICGAMYKQSLTSFGVVSVLFHSLCVAVNQMEISSLLAEFVLFELSDWAKPSFRMNSCF